MAKSSSSYVCQECGASSLKWSGRCESCQAWNSIVEEAAKSAVPLGKGVRGSGGLGKKGGRKISFADLNAPRKNEDRRITGLGEFDRVCGGGLVPGSALLIGGDPGIGKSTLLLQVVGALSQTASCAYISGEESGDQIKMRAQRLGLGEAPVRLATATDVGAVIATLEQGEASDVVVIDSIQTMYVDGLDSAPGTVSQVRASAGELIRMAKDKGLTLFLVGHVTKDGQIAGPRVLEHMVDTVLYFEGDRGHQFRILRAVKNRFGPTDEIGVFEMRDTGLSEVTNPSSLFLGDRTENIPGAAVFAGIEGSRPILMEIQALVAPSTLGTPRRTVVGWDSGRLAMTLAVLEARCGIALSNHDVYLNVAGGLRISEPAADLAVAAAVLSSLTERPLPAETIVFGEVGLSGEIRSVGQMDARMKEAAKLGFTRAIAPALSPRQGGKKDAKKKPGAASALNMDVISHVRDLAAMFDAATGHPSGNQPGNQSGGQVRNFPKPRRNGETR